MIKGGDWKGEVRLKRNWGVNNHPVVCGWGSGGVAARVARQGGGSAPDTPPANPDSTSGCTASIPALASGKALVHICWTSGSDSGPLFALIKREVEGCGGEGARTGVFLWKPHWVFLFEAESGLDVGRQVRKRQGGEVQPRHTIALMLLCLAASWCPACHGAPPP